MINGWFNRVVGPATFPQLSTIHYQKNQMSHFTTIQTQIKDIDALRETCAEMGFGLLQNVAARGIGTEQRGDYIIRLAGPCDIALQHEANGTFGLSTDWWG